MARQELSFLRAAVNHHLREGLHDKIVTVIVPEKSLPRDRWLTRSEAAHLLLTTWRYREQQKGKTTGRRSRKHVAQFMLVARYFGSRAGVICTASMESVRPETAPWVDLVNGVFYGKAVRHRDTNKRRQTIRIPPPLLLHLRIWRKNGQSYVVEWRGGPIKRVSKAHKAAARAAGFAVGVTAHTWRHSLATWLMQDGVDVWAAAGYLAMSVETLTRVYGHHHPDHSGKVHDAFSARRRQQIANNISEQKQTLAHSNASKSRVVSA